MLLTATFATTITSCSDDLIKEMEPAKSINITDDEFMAGYMNFDFSINLLNTLNATEPGNVIISPLNIMRNNGIFINGTSDETQKEILNALNYEGSIEDYNSYIYKVFGELKTIDPFAQVNYGSALWIDESKKLTLQSNFSNIMKEMYSADIFNTYGLSTDNARNAINDWVSSTTNNKIADLLRENLPESTKMFEASALYFKGMWKNPFDKNRTKTEQFNNYDGNKTEVSMMKGDMKYRSIVTETYSAVKIPMGNDAFEMVIILPENGISLEDCSKNLTTKEFRKFLNGNEKSLVHISLPSFNIYKKSDLKNAFLANGITRLFNKDQAQFNMFENKDVDNGKQNEMCIDKMNQYVRLMINEEGCESSTVVYTGLLGAADSPLAPDEFTFTVDRPFLLMIKEKSTPCPLILATIKYLSK